MSDKNPEDLTSYQKFYARSMNISAFGLSAIIFFHMTFILYAILPFLAFIAAVMAYYGVYRYYTWIKQSPEKLPLYVMPLAYAYCVVIITFLIMSIVAFEIVSIHMSTALFYAALLALAYKLWPFMDKYFGLPFTKMVVK